MAVEELSDRIRQILANRGSVREQRMFGGMCFMLNGNMLVGPMKGGGLLARVGKDAYQEALKRPGAGPMKFTGKEMPGFVEVSGDVLEDDATLEDWITLCEAFVAGLPAK
ncbi:MAG: TfoX/Sxy family protein [Hyphomicrobiaceae bacterium]|nr:TfoX/Sxy family protein [Hyphomicrobiaceae bacterium]